MGRGRAMVRLPNSAAKEFLLQAEGLQVPNGSLTFKPISFGTGIEGNEGALEDFFIRGLPLIWRSEEVIRKVAEKLGWLQSFEEVVQPDEPFPLIRVSVWVRKGFTPPSSIEVALEGWTVRVEVLRGASSRVLSFVEVVSKGTKGGSGCFGKAPCGRYPSVWEKGEPSKVAAVPDGGLQKLPARSESKVTQVVKSRSSGCQSDRERVFEKASVVAGKATPCQESSKRSARCQSAVRLIPDGGPSEEQILHRALSTAISPALQILQESLIEKVECLSGDRCLRSRGAQLAFFPRGGSIPEVELVLNHGSGHNNRSGSGISLLSEPSIHPSLGPGSWANFFDEMGCLKWQWCPHTTEGESEARRAIFGSPPMTPAQQLSGGSISSAAPQTQVNLRLKSIVVGRTEHSGSSSKASCESQGSLVGGNFLCLEEGVLSVCGSPQALKDDREALETVAEQSPERDCTKLPSAERFVNSPGCQKVCSVGVILNNNATKGRLKVFLGPSRRFDRWDGVSQFESEDEAP
ncbi:hypothetical protein QJS10_CPB21g01444 [Acorus calamus]|uniref:DUF4283 domain-containing protein n=1 Tax=Acorus calamus TaxID=4465 RepID=A0AAV9C5P2_ACOCL|nr:hypothetical protein QJS10_CPB21g01444 [Acorus calamus]